MQPATPHVCLQCFARLLGRLVVFPLLFFRQQVAGHDAWTAGRAAALGVKRDARHHSLPQRATKAITTGWLLA